MNDGNYGNKKIEYYGIVLEDKKDDSKEIKVYIKELLPTYSGDIKAKEKDYNVSGGKSGYAGTVKAVNYILAIYDGEVSNEKKVPDVKKGEQVRVYCYSDSDIYYWTATARDGKLRRTEKTGIVAANTNEPADLNDSNTYGLELDTKEAKRIKIYTSQGSGEKHQYTIILDAANSNISISDEDDNLIKIETEVPRILLKNKEGTFVELAKKNITMVAVEDINIKAGRQMVIDAPAWSFKNKKGGGSTVWEASEVAINAKSVMFNSECISLNGAVEAKNIVAGPVHSTGYSTVGGLSGFSMRRSLSRAVANTIGTYKSPAINIMTGVVKAANNTPNYTGSTTPNRHCAAWEDVQAALNIIASDLVKIDARIGYGNSASEINAEAAQAIMPLNTGE